MVMVLKKHLIQIFLSKKVYDSYYPKAITNTKIIVRELSDKTKN